MSKSVGGSQQQQPANNKKQNSPTVQLTPSEVVSIDGDYLPQPRPRPPPVNASSMRTSPDMASPPANWGNRLRAGPIDGRDWPEPQSPSEKDSVRSDRPSDSDAPTYASQYVNLPLDHLHQFKSFLTTREFFGLCQKMKIPFQDFPKVKKRIRFGFKTTLKPIMVKEKLKSWRSLEEYFTTIERPLKINCGIVHLRICF